MRRLWLHGESLALLAMLKRKRAAWRENQEGCVIQKARRTVTLPLFPEPRAMTEYPPEGPVEPAFGELEPLNDDELQPPSIPPNLPDEFRLSIVLCGANP